MECGHCGKPVEEGTVFCPHCGAQVGRAAGAVAPGGAPAKAGTGSLPAKWPATLCTVLSWILLAWSMMAMWITVETAWPIIEAWFGGAAFTGGVAMAIFELAGYGLGVVGAAAGIVDAGNRSRKGTYKPFWAVLAACAFGTSALCMLAAGFAHLTFCTVCTTPFGSFSYGMWTHFVAMLVGAAAFALFAVLHRKKPG